MTKKSEPEQLIKLHFGKTFVELTEDLPVRLLLKLGRRVCSTDFVVRFYYNRRHNKFYRNKKQLKKAIRRAWCSRAHQYKIIEVLENYYKVIINHSRYENYYCEFA